MCILTLGAWWLRVARPAGGPEGPAPGIPMQVTDEYAGLLRISELMSKNRATVQDENGAFSDWIELENISSQPVDLTGWALSDREGEGKLPLPSESLGPGQLRLVFCGGEEAPFSLSQGESVYLLSPQGLTEDSALCSSGREGISLVRQDDGSFAGSVWASPGFPNTAQGYADFCASRAAPGPLVIQEAMVANSLYPVQPGAEPEDWVELKNISGAPLSLAGFHLSDKRNDYSLFALPELSLGPGESLLVLCSGDESRSDGSFIHANFSLDAASEELYLTDSQGRLIDYVWLHDIPSNGSMGRMDGENGFFYFAVPSPLEANAGGQRRISAAPVSLSPDGLYDGVDGLSVELSAPGSIYYTTDGSVPGTDSAAYTGPIALSGTTILRAVAVEEGALPSPVATLSFFLNEGHSLPVLSLVADDLAAFDAMYNAGQKDLDLSANLALYDGDSSFNRACSVSMKGWTSLSLPKKSLGVDFDGIHGGDLTDCDLFGNGITEYSSLSIRGGQDYAASIIRNELFEELCLDMSGKVFSQESKFCALYINGRYWGLYCLKEDFSRQYYASHRQVSKDSVTMYRTPTPMDSAFFQEVVQFAWYNDLSVEENYQHIAERVDLDSLIDWFIIEGFSANSDIQGNARVFRSSETDGKWQFAAYDFDWAFFYGESDFYLLLDGGTNAGNQLPPLINGLLGHPDFRARFLARFAELNRTTLSNEHVLETLDRLADTVAPEVPRERERWGLSLDAWYGQLDTLRAFVRDKDWARHNVEQLTWLLQLTPEELALFDQ